MIQRLQITKGETFKYRSEETQTIQYGVEFGKIIGIGTQKKMEQLSGR